MKRRLLAVIISAMCFFCTLPSSYAQNIPTAKGINRLKFAAQISGEMPKEMKFAIFFILPITATAILFYRKGKKK